MTNRAVIQNQREDAIVAAVSSRFRTFGGGRGSDMNPVADALKDEEPMFAAGVDVRDVVRFVLSTAHASQ